MSVFLTFGPKSNCHRVDRAHRRFLCETSGRGFNPPGSAVGPQHSGTTMKIIRRRKLLALAALIGCAAVVIGRTNATAQNNPSAEEAAQVATDAYIYGYSLITTEITRVQFSNVKRYPPADFRGVSAPNADTLYSIAWLDLAEPQVFSHPDMGERYYMFEMTDLWMTDFDTPGTRTTGEKAAS